MAPFPFFQRESLAELARNLQLTAYTPVLEMEGLLTGIDNVRHDVFLSPKFVEITREHIRRLIVRDGKVEDLAKDPTPLAFDVPPQIFQKAAKEEPKPVEVLDFKSALSALLIDGVNRAKNENKPALDMLLRLATVKFLRAEMLAQFGEILEKLRARQSEHEGPREHLAAKAVQVRERVSGFQLAKKTLLRKCGQELFQTLREVEKESLVRMRRALFGSVDSPSYAILLNRLMFSDDGHDDAILAEHYVMLGNFERDLDRFANVEEIARSFLVSLLGPGEYQPEIDPLLNAPENAQELLGGGTPDDSTPKGHTQKALLSAWVELLESSGVLERIIAAYETAPLVAEYAPTINAQQLKNALISKVERARVEQLLAQHTRLSPASFEAALRRVSRYGAADRAKAAVRFLRDYLIYHRDLRSFEKLLASLDRVNLIMSDRLRELSAINSTLYEFLLPTEQTQREDKVMHHVILKADVRDSTTLTRTLIGRGLNPASYFGLNFYDPINKLIPKYDATKVFVEGDAVILALFGYEGKQAFPVARTCVLAREMVSVVRAYNERSQRDGLPILEIGIGISYQDSAPLYLMDGNHRIMISKALNESDRLSGCNKGARLFIKPGDNAFSVYSFKTVEDEDTGGNPDEFLMRYNVGGIHLNEAGFRALESEITLDCEEVPLHTVFGVEEVRIHSGLVPLGNGIFHMLAIREARIARIDGSNFSFKSYTDRRYFEVCTNKVIYDYLETRAKTAATAD